MTPRMTPSAPTLLLGGEVAARTGGVSLVFFHGRVGVPTHSLPQRVNSDIPSGAGHLTPSPRGRASLRAAKIF